MDRRRVCSWVVAAAGLGIWSWGVLACWGQVPRPRPAQPIQRVQIRQRVAPNRPNVDPMARPDEELSLDGVFLPPDRGAKRRLELAQQMLDENRFGEAVRLLGSLLENPEDYFFKPNPEQPVFRSLKAEAGRLISTMPGEGRDSYELQFGARARQMLKQAAASGNLAELAEISRRFFYTQAGQEATFLLGRHNLDQNRPLAAALCFERLRDNPAVSQRLEPVLSLTLATCWLRAGKPDKAKDVLIRLKHQHPKAEILLAGKPVNLFASDAQALAWMQAELGAERPGHPAEAEGWTLFRGDESRNAPSPGSRPLLNPRWRQRTTEDRSVERFVGKLRQDYLNQDIVALPSLHPLAVGDVVLMRTAFALQAVDFQHGKLVWKYASTDDALEQFLNAGTSQPTGQTAQLLSGLDQRMWDDAIYGTISSDGGQVYYVDDLGLAGVTASPLRTFMPNGQQRFSANSRGANRLAARELRTQVKLKWEVGGLTGEDEPKLAGAFFLGPPLPLLGRLYALADIKGQEIRLVVLSAKTGSLEWSQQLAVVEPNVSQDSFRRNAGATPSFADGVLVCPTSAGAIVGIDLTTRSLLWGYQYPRLQQSNVDRFNAMRFGIYPGSERRASEHWADGCVTIAEGRALVTPVESDQMYCLNLVDGKELWKQNRGNHLYVGCVHRGNVILIGHGTVSALKLADGETAWADIELPSGSIPSGRGFYTGDAYYLPLTSAEVARINLQSGQIEERARSRGGNVPGNLICYRGSIISQGADYVDAYFQLDALKQQIAKALEDHPDDPKSLATLGEVKLDQGALGEAIDLFRRSYALKNDDTTREQLVESLLEGLRVDFAAHRGSLAELNALIEQKQHRLAYLRLMALGLQKAGEITPAFEAYLQLADAETSAGLDTLDGIVSVRRDRWIRAQLEQLRAAATPNQQQRIDTAVAARLQSALEADSIDALRTFIAVFGGHPAAEQARDALVSKLGANDLLEREMLLRNLERSTSEATAAGAVARLAQMMQEAGRGELAATYYRQLAGRFREVVCRGGKTGQQLLDELPPENPTGELLKGKRAWPLGKVVSKEDKAATRNTPQPRLPRAVDLEIVGPTGPFFDDVTVSFDSQGPVLVGQDGLGEKRFRILLNEQGRRPIPANNRYPGYNAPALSYVSVNGSLLVLSMGNQVV
ncbi:MAG: PQQ-binding-like beta-propeller repeat protein, partial [Planctomycetia bacterium]|nr:PQQ-binding-like beta-propeller repeat protein [Planctomycetia bacterium]